MATLHDVAELLLIDTRVLSGAAVSMNFNGDENETWISNGDTIQRCRNGNFVLKRCIN